MRITTTVVPLVLAALGLCLCQFPKTEGRKIPFNTFQNVSVDAVNFAREQQRNASVDAGLPRSADEHLVTSLPGKPHEFQTSSWSGHLPVDDKAGGGKLFYWLFEAEEKPAEKPLMIWLNGGPGCSSFDGLLLELGPFRPLQNGSLAYNEHSWHKVANVLFVDQPVGTGLSFPGTTGYAPNQDVVNAHFYHFLQKFFQIHRQFLKPKDSRGVVKTREVFFFGESYAGHYIPHISDYILSHRNKEVQPNDVFIDIKALGIGNGWTHPYSQYNYAPFARGAGLINDYQETVLSERYELCRMTLDDGASYSHHCASILNEIVVGSTVPGGPGVNYYDIRLYTENAGSDWPAAAPYQEAYLNRADVRQALHATEAWHEFTECSGEVGANLFHEDGLTSLNHVVNLLETGVRVLFYNGQFDMICNHLSTQQFLNTMQWSQAEAFEKAERFVWANNKTPAGYGRSTPDRLLTFLVVLGGSHMVPMDVPEPALNMVSRFISNSSFDDSLQHFKSPPQFNHQRSANSHLGLSQTSVSSWTSYYLLFALTMAPGMLWVWHRFSSRHNFSRQQYQPVQ